MEPNENNPLKPQPTGSLKLMTVFIAVLALHVLVIGGFTVWHLLYPANADADLALDKSHKSKITGDSTIGDVTAADSSSTSASPDKSAAATPANSDATASTDTATVSNEDASAPAAATATVTAPTAPVANASQPTANSVITVPATPAMPATPTVVEDASAAAASPALAAQAPSGPIHQGPVVNPPETLAPPSDASTATTAAEAPAATAPAVAVEGAPYIVKHGDSLARIAHRHHIALAKLRSANSLASDSLHLGQKLVIPGRTAKAANSDASETLASAPSNASTPSTSSAPMAQPVQDSDNVSLATTPSSSLASTLPKHTRHVATAPTHHLYTVVKGDTLTKIAKRYHTTTNAIMAANSLTNAGRLSIGQKLHIPAHLSRESSTAQQAAPADSEPHSAAKGQFANYVQ